MPWWRPQAYYDEPGRGTLARDGGGVLLTQAIHSLDLFRSLVGVSKVVAAQARTTGLHRMETEDYVSALLETDSGAPATLVTTTAAYPGHPERIEIIGTKGYAALVGGGSKCLPRRAQGGGRGRGLDRQRRQHHGLSRTTPTAAVIEDFLDAIVEGTTPSSPARRPWPRSIWWTPSWRPPAGPQRAAWEADA